MNRVAVGGLVFGAAITLLVPGTTAWAQSSKGRTVAPKKGAGYQLSVEGTLERIRRRLDAARKEVEYTLRKYRRERASRGVELKLEKLEGLAEQMKRLSEQLEHRPAEQGGNQELSNRLDQVEDDIENMLGTQDKLIETIKKDRLNWSGGFRVTANSFHFIDRSTESVPVRLDLVLDDYGQPIYDPSTGSLLVTPVYEQRQRNIDKWYGSNWVERLFLSMYYDITDNLRFYARLAVLKYMNELKPQSPTLDMHSTRYPRDPTLRIERAYIDWFITDWLVFSTGRIASPEGPPAELKEDTTRSATWGVQMVEAEMETAMFTIHFDTFIDGLDNFNLRLFYMPYTTHTDFQLSDHTRLFKHEPGFEEMHVFGGMFELTVPGAGNNIVQLGAAYIPAFPPRNVPIYIPELDKSIPPTGSTSDTLGEYAMFTSLLEFTDIAKSGLDLFLAYHMTVLKPTDGRIVYDIPVELPVYHPVTGPTGTVFQGTSRLEIGLASYEEGPGTTNFGHLIYTGLRWTLPFWQKYRTRVGAEFNWGSKYHVAWSSPSDLLVNRLSTKGIAWEVYLIQELVPGNMFTRIGFLELRRDYDGLYLGPTLDIDQTIRNFYVLVDAHW
ncbi:MAG: DUF3373 family protein [Deltaproteobacteria bacterium]|nr:MAG: DUF3373 family protein [Deltaproteobacteria bacterium]